ncbi:MAG: hypothetical protein ACI8RZ_001908 [Myxococcota bacterium]|jgi:hypothetical protein
MDRKTVRKSHDALTTTRAGRGRMFAFGTFGGKEVLDVSRFHCAETSDGITIDDKLKTSMRRQLRSMLSRDHQGAGCAGLFYVADGVPTFRVCVRQRFTTRQLSDVLTPLAERLGVVGFVVIKDRVG